MAEKKKIFSESDFDKDKQIFTPEDFKKGKDVPKAPPPPPTPIPNEGKGNGNENTGKSKTGKIIGGIAAAAAILAGVYFFGPKGDDKSGTDAGTPPTEQVAQAGETAQSDASTQTDVPEDGTTEGANSVSDTPEALSSTGNTAASAPSGGDVVENAKRVIRGDFGNGQERKDKLGSAYSEIQSKVNEMYRQGLVY